MNKYHKTFDERGEIRRIKIHMWTVWLLACLRTSARKKR